MNNHRSGRRAGAPLRDARQPRPLAPADLRLGLGLGLGLREPWHESAW
ncbi:hypothetical protein [Streptomyces sp. NPDC055681]